MHEGVLHAVVAVTLLRNLQCWAAVQAVLGQWRTSHADLSTDHVVWSAGSGPH